MSAFLGAIARWSSLLERISADGRPGGDLLSHALRRSTIGAEGFHGRVRDGIGWVDPRYGHQAVDPQGLLRALSLAGARTLSAGCPSPIELACERVAPGVSIDVFGFCECWRWLICAQGGQGPSSAGPTALEVRAAAQDRPHSSSELQRAVVPIISNNQVS